MRPIDADELKSKKTILWDEALGHVACVLVEDIDGVPTLTADDYFDAVDRIKPCPNCRYTLFGELTENQQKED